MNYKNYVYRYLGNGYYSRSDSRIFKARIQYKGKTYLEEVFVTYDGEKIAFDEGIHVWI